MAPRAPISVAALERSSYIRYPTAMASYSEIVSNAEVFRSTLERFHSALGTRLTTPTVGGKELDLHKFFVEVTCRGGIEKVIHDRRLKEITSSFSFPSTATNASFVLRRYYMSLLYHYERLYLLQCDGWTKPAATPAPLDDVPTPVQVASSTEPVLSPQDSQSPQQDAQLPPQDAQLLPQDAKKVGRKRTITGQMSKTRGENSQVCGVIDGKFEHGYLISVQFGTDTLRGIVYHVDEGCSSLVPCSTVNNISLGGGRRTRKRRKVKMLDPNHPKPNLSGYNFFFAEQHAKIRHGHSSKERETSKTIGELWNKLTDEEKAVYQAIGTKDKERYRREMAVYRERQKTGYFISNAFPIQQIPAGMAVPIACTSQKLEENNQLLLLDIERDDSGNGISDMEQSPEPDIGAHPTNMDIELPNGIHYPKMPETDSGVGPSGV